MTVINSTRKVRANGDGIVVAFQFSFPAKVATDVVVKKIVNATGVATTQTVGVDYTIVLNTVTEGGTVTYTVAPTALEDSFLIRETVQDQQTALPIGGNFPEISVENEIDRSRLIDIELQEQIDRSLLIPDTETALALTIPLGTGASNRASLLWGWNSAGDDLALFSDFDIVSVITIKGDLVQGSDLGVGEQLLIGATSAVLQVVAGKAAWVTNPILLIPTIADFTSATHSHANAAGGGTIAHDLPRSYLAGLGTSQDTDADADILIAVGECRDDTDVDDMRLTTPITKQIDAVWAVGDDAGGNDGSLTADTWYHLFLIKRSDTGVVDAIFSLSATAPTLPTNYDRQRRIGSVLTDATSDIIVYKQNGDEFIWDVVVQDYVAASVGTAAVTRTLTVPTGVVVNAIHIYQGAETTFTTNIHHLVTSLDQVDTAPTGVLYTVLTVNESGRGFGSLQIKTNTSGQIRVRISATSANIFSIAETFGWIDTRGRED